MADALRKQPRAFVVRLYEVYEPDSEFVYSIEGSRVDADAKAREVGGVVVVAEWVRLGEVES